MITLHASTYPTATGVVGFLHEAGRGAEADTLEEAEEQVFEFADEYTEETFEIEWVRS